MENKYLNREHDTGYNTKKKTQQKNNQKLAAQIKPTYYCRANNESHLNCNCLQDNVLYQATVKISRQ